MCVSKTKQNCSCKSYLIPFLSGTSKLGQHASVGKKVVEINSDLSVPSTVRSRVPESTLLHVPASLKKDTIAKVSDVLVNEQVTDSSKPKGVTYVTKYCTHAFSWW